MEIPNSLKMQERAKAVIPGMTQLLSKRPDRFSLGVWPGYFSRAKGADIWDLDGHKYTDMSLGGIGVNVLGYADQDVDNAVGLAIRNGTSCTLNCVEEVELAELLCDLHPWASMVRYARTGGEAMAMAVRIARAFTGRDIIAFCGYHGWHDWYLAANLGTENALGEHLISGLRPDGIPRGLTGTAFPFQYNRLEELEQIVASHGKNLAAIVMEPIRSQEPLPDFMAGVRSMADDSGAVLIVDEISAGFRMNTGGAHLLYFPEPPDIAVFSKALGNGYPIAAVIGKTKVMESSQRSFISSTYWTERIGPVAALAMIKKHDSANVGEHLVGIGRQIQEGWQQCAEANGLKISVSGIYPMSHFVFEHERFPEMKAYFIQLMLAKGFLASNSFYAMYAHTQDHVKRYLHELDGVFAEISKALASGTLDEKMAGQPAVAGFKRIS